jgi:cytochrome c oxidase subunit 1
VYGSAHLPLTLVAIGGIILWLATITFYVVFAGTLLGRRLEAPVPIPFAQAFGGKQSYAIAVGKNLGREAAGVVAHPHLSPLAKVLEHLGLLTLIAALATLAAYIPIFWPLVTNMTAPHGWKVW